MCRLKCPLFCALYCSHTAVATNVMSSIALMFSDSHILASLVRFSYHMSPEEVIKFCTDCVLSEGEGECEIPEGFYDQLRP